MLGLRLDLQSGRAAASAPASTSIHLAVLCVLKEMLTARRAGDKGVEALATSYSAVPDLGR